jgi:tripeptidyl-peptidase-1
MKHHIIAVIGLVTCAAAAPAGSSYVMHEKHQFNNKWLPSDVKLRRDAVIPMSIGLTQRNLDKGYEYLMDVSHPTSPNYGKHWTLDKVGSCS